MELACELMKWPFRELMLGINEVLHGFSKSSMQLLVVNIINVRVLGGTHRLWSILPWEPPHTLCSGAGAPCQLGAGTQTWTDHCWRCAGLQSYLLDEPWT